MENKHSEIHDELLELENKGFLYKLRRKLIKYLKSLFNKDNQIVEHNVKMEKLKNDFNEKTKTQNDNFELFSQKLNEEKNKEIKLIEEHKNKVIEENKKKYNDIILYLETIKNDKQKLTEFFNKTNIFNL